MLKYLITLLILASSISSSHAGNRIMKCISTDGHVTYARNCSKGDTPSQIQIDDSGKLIQSIGTDSDTNSNEQGLANKALLLRETVGNSTASQNFDSTVEASSLDGSSSSGSGGRSISGRDTGAVYANTDKDESDGNVAAGKNFSSTTDLKNSGIDITEDTSNGTAVIGVTDNRTTTIDHASTTDTISNTNTNITDIEGQGPAVTSTETEVVEEEAKNLDSDNAVNTNRDDTNVRASLDSGLDNSDSVDPVNSEASTELDLGFIDINISRVSSDKYNHAVNSIRIDKNNGEIIINGHNFGRGPDVQLYDRFDNGTTGKVIPLKNSENPACWANTSDLDTRENKGPLSGCWSEYGTRKPRYSSIAYSGNHSMQIYDNSTGMLQFKKKFDKTTEAFVSYWVHVPQTENSYFPGTYWFREDGTIGGIGDAKHGEFPKDSSWKMNWLLQDGKHDRLNANLVMPSHIGYGIFSLSGNDNKLANLGKADNWWSWKYWNRISVWIKADSDDPLATGEFLFQIMSQDRGLYQVSTSVPIFDKDGPTEKYFNSINFPGWIRPGSITKPLYDDIYIATGPNAVSRVEIGNSNNYHSSTRVEILQLSNWSNDQITLLFDNKKGLDLEGRPGYLYITDNRGRVNKNGYPLHK